ncbi:hypothetical protein [Chondromyces crocatus]|nr:hypothetical protein [Chondromyces crocatus]
MRSRFLLLAAFCAPAPIFGVAVGCGDTIVVDNPGDGGGGGVGAGRADGGQGAGSVDGGGDALQEYVDPGCPDQPPPIVDLQCDPYDQHNGDCAVGEGCFIFVRYPQEACGQEIYGSRCGPAGVAGQGDPCLGSFECQGGFVCVVTGSGNQCVRLCPLVGDDGCPAGLVCEPIDVEGFGGCL